MKTRLLVAVAVATGLAFAPVAFAEDAMKPGMAKDMKKDTMMEKKTDTMMDKKTDTMAKPGAMMDKKDSMSKDGMKK